jgi:hypothetical protein
MQFLYKKSLTQINENGKKKAQFKIVQGKNSIVQEIDGISHNGQTFQIKKTVKRLKRFLPRENNNVNNMNNMNNSSVNNHNNENNNMNNSGGVLHKLPISGLNNRRTNNNRQQKLTKLVVNPPSSAHKVFRLNSKDIMKLLEQSQIKLKKKEKTGKGVRINHPINEVIKEKKARKPRVELEKPIKMPKDKELKKFLEKHPKVSPRSVKHSKK